MLPKQPNSYFKYSTMAFQMGAIIALFVWAGIKLDEYLNIESKVFTIILSLLGIFASLYLTLKDLINPKN
ncbi:MAG: AtpZ/AtpI family protein [Bacteroidia bacterium]|nr:AtpZ/AtpI family protein [Bacteroidia bacterium]